jgi:pyridoxine 5'-phosphate synthase PdxJ
LQESGRYFGVTHIDDGALQVTYELPKRVSWDQKRLAEMAERITAAGENVSDFIDVDYSVSESRFKNWPSTLREQFEAARTVKPGKPSFRLALVEGGAA